MRCFVHATTEARAGELADRLRAGSHAVEGATFGPRPTLEAVQAADVVFVDHALGSAAIHALCNDVRRAREAHAQGSLPVLAAFGAMLSAQEAAELLTSGVEADVGALDAGLDGRLCFVARSVREARALGGRTPAGAVSPLSAGVDDGGFPALEERTILEKLAADRLRMVGALTANLAHEVNNSLVYVLANLRMAKRRLHTTARDAGDDTGELVDDALEGSERIGQIIADLGRFRFTDALSTTDVHDILDACLRMMRTMLGPNVQVVRRFDEVPRVRANQARLAQAIVNVLMNIEHVLPPRGSSPPGVTALPTVTITTRRRGDDKVFIDIQDSGPGLSTDQLSHIFEPFFTTKGDRGHLGLGLAMGRALVTSQGGDITLTSSVEGGTTVTIELPAATVPKEKADAPKEPDARKRRVLVVDDEPFVAKSIRDSLLRYDIDIAASAREAMALLDEASYDVIVCDVIMPGMTGKDLYEQLTRRKQGEEARMVFITGGAFTADAARFVAHVKNPCVEKPFDMTTLVAAIEDVARTTAARS